MDGSRAASCSETFATGALRSAVASICATVLPSFFTSVSVPVPVTTTASSPIAAWLRVKSTAESAPATTTTILVALAYPTRRTRRVTSPAGTPSWNCPVAFDTVARVPPTTRTWAPSTGRFVTASVTVPRMVPVPCARATGVPARDSTRATAAAGGTTSQRRGEIISASLCDGKRRDAVERRGVTTRAPRPASDGSTARDGDIPAAGKVDGAVLQNSIPLPSADADTLVSVGLFLVARRADAQAPQCSRARHGGRA